MASEVLGRNHAEELVAGLDSVGTVDEFCKEWETKWKMIVVAAQGILKIFFPEGAKVLGYIISVVDRCCANPQKP